ncbi:hypothetical protein L1987_71500 [Smallanthus sonchifolius]|uniref:Uncharacterized protein n=1 Tax=Smallanthus sonchifolius TaxID=185202 RepID=A0ACB9AWX6_9ASTR|nr:hypothetical protein L1987_71500 [Smallanthus sonchifolius]
MSTMKINVGTLKGTKFEMQVNHTDTVADIKRNIETVLGPAVYPAAQQLLVHQGKVLKDATTMEENKVVENSFIVITLSKSKSPASGLSTTSAARVNVAQPSEPSQASESAPNVASSESTTQSIHDLVSDWSETNNVYDEAASKVAGSSSETTIQQFLDMGGGSWDRETVIRALRAAYNNPERAVDYLYSGIPEQVEVTFVAQPTAPASQPTAATAAAIPLDLSPQIV